MAKYDFPTVRRGDTYNGTQFTVLLNDSPVELSNVTISMDMRLTQDGASEKRFETGGKGITVDADPTSGIFTLDKQVIDVADFGNFYYDIEITFLDTDEKKTWIWGLWPIAEDITHD